MRKFWHTNGTIQEEDVKLETKLGEIWLKPMS